MDIRKRFWNEFTNRVESRYLKLVFLGHTTASDLLDEFKSGLTDVDMDNILQVSMDGPSVNWKFYDSITTDREKSKLSGLINIRSCGRHVLHGAFKTGVEAAGWEIKKLLNGLFQLFHDSPTGRSDYLKITDSTTDTKMFFATRWLEDASVAETAIDVWDNVVKMFEFWGNLPELKLPKCKGYGDVPNAIKDNMVLARLHCFCHCW